MWVDFSKMAQTELAQLPQPRLAAVTVPHLSCPELAKPVEGITGQQGVSRRPVWVLLMLAALSSSEKQ